VRTQPRTRHPLRAQPARRVEWPESLAAVVRAGVGEVARATRGAYLVRVETSSRPAYYLLDAGQFQEWLKAKAAREKH